MAPVVQARCAELGVERSFGLAGFVPYGARLLAMYRAAHIFVHVSLTEGSPQVVIEAMGAATPVVATDVGSVRDALDGGRAGVLVPAGDRDALVDGVLELTDDLGLRKNCVERGLIVARRHARDVEAARVAGFIAGRRAATPSSNRGATRQELQHVRSGVMAASRVDVSVLVPVLNEATVIERTAAAMRSQHFDGAVELLYLEGGSGDGTRALLERLAAEDDSIRVLDNPSGSIPAALNIGLREARGEFVARMDAHSFYPPEYLAMGVERLGRGDVDWVSGPQLAEGVNAWSEAVALALSIWLGVGGARFRYRLDQEIEVDTGYSGVWRRSTLEELDGWDEEWPVNEDAELAARVRERGGRVVCVPGMAARYVPRRSLVGLARQYWTYGQFRAKTSRHHPESMRRSNLIPPALTAVAAASVIAPGPVARIARRLLAGYGLCLIGESARQASGGRPTEAFLLPAVLGTMHLSWGAGFLLGCVKFGPPVEAIKCAVKAKKRE